MSNAVNRERAGALGLGPFAGRASIRIGLSLVAAAAFVAAPGFAEAGNGKGSGKDKGTINPTNTPVMEAESLTSMAAAPDPVEDDAPVSDTDWWATWMAALGNDPLAQIDAYGAHEFATGEGVVVAVLDAGFNLDHESLQGRLHVAPYDVIDDDGDPTDLGDGIDGDGDGVVDEAVGHGTFVAGMVLAAAPGATILPVRVMDDDGHGSTDDIVAGIEYAISMGADVINLSLQAHNEIGQLKKCLDDAQDANIVVVVSAGNDGQDNLNKLAGENSVVSVGAVDGNDHVAEFSNTDDDLGCFAPGVDLIGPHGGSADDTVCVWSGTSFAAGIVSGAAAVVRQSDPSASSADVAAILGASVDPVIDPSGADQEAGRIDLMEAIDG